MLLFVEYPKCSTCQKARKWLEERGLEFQDRHIVEQNPTKEELKAWYEKKRPSFKTLFQYQRKSV